MNKYRIRSTIYGVFLIVSLLVIAILFYYNYSIEEDRIYEYQELNVEINDVYEYAYVLINREKDGFDDDECSLINFNEFSEYFTNNVIEKIKKNLTYENNNYYDCNNYMDSLKNNTIFSSVGIRAITIQYVDDDIIYAKGEVNGYTEYIIFKKINDKWYIDLFE